jgi:hypothetical protein
MSNTTAPKTLIDFINRLVEEKGMSNLDPKVLAQVKSDLLSRVEDRLDAAIIRELPTAVLPEFEKLVDERDVTKTQEFCRTHIPDIDELVAAELLGFRRTYGGT